MRSFRQNGITVKPKIRINSYGFFLRPFWDITRKPNSLGNIRSLRFTLPLHDTQPFTMCTSKPFSSASSRCAHSFRCFGRKSIAFDFFTQDKMPEMMRDTNLQEFILDIETPYCDESQARRSIEDAQTCRRPLPNRSLEEFNQPVVTLRKIAWSDSFIEEGMRRNMGLTKDSQISPVNKMKLGRFSTLPYLQFMGK